MAWETLPCAARRPHACLLLRFLYIGCLQTFRPVCNIKFDFLTFVECFISFHLDCGKMREHIFSTFVRRNKTITLGITEPLDYTY